MENDYFIDLEREVLSEIGASIIAGYMRYMDENNIESNDNEKALLAIFDNLVRSKNKLFTEEYDSFDSLKMLEGQFKFAQKCLDDLKAT